jgi:NAD(P)H-hydrate repair Nnr-like enzyme with NAD(P)H-hydrate dehydratase domain
MNQEYWQQQSNEPLFPNLIWSRPETKQGAGKLVIIGGQAGEFIHVAASYNSAEQTGAGTIRVFMPESTRKLTKDLMTIEYAASNQSGSFAREAIAELTDASLWADSVLIAGDLGKNSETSLMLDNYLRSGLVQTVVPGSALQSLSLPSQELFSREGTILVIDFADLQKLTMALNFETPATSGMAASAMADILHRLTTEYPIGLVVTHDFFIWTAYKGRVVSTKKSKQIPTLAAEVAVWTMQNPTKLLEALASAVHS